MREQRAQHTSLSGRATARADEQFQPPPIILDAARHRAGHSSGMHPEDQPYVSQTLRRRVPALPAPAEEEVDDVPRTRSSAIRRYVTTTPIPHPRPPRRWHPLLRIGLTGIAMVISTMALLILPPAYQRWQDDLHYGYPRTYQADAVVGHGDSAVHPSHFIALNWHGHLEVIELAGGDPGKATIYVGPTLYQPDADLVPVTLSFEDMDHDGTPDLVLHFEGQLVVFLNNGKAFQVGHP